MLKKIAIFGKSIEKEGIEYLQNLLNRLEFFNCTLSIYEPFYKKIENQVRFPSNLKFFNTHEELKDNAEILLSIGGDGTLLDTITLIRNSGINVLGINLGLAYKNLSNH
jgi:NAD+ kinase